MICSYCKKNNIQKLVEGKYPFYPFVITKKAKNDTELNVQEILDIKYYICDGCGFIFSDVDDSVIKRYNDTFYKKYYNYYSRYDLVDFEVDSFLNAVSLYINQSKSVLEIGCYDGYVLNKIKEKHQNTSILGIEPFEKGAKECEKRKIPCINDYFPPANRDIGVFDLIFSRHVIEHVPDPFEFLKEQINHLGEKGVIILETPNVDWGIINDEPMMLHTQHIVLLRKKYIKDMLKKLHVSYVDVIEIEYRLIVVCSNEQYFDMIAVDKWNTDDDKVNAALINFKQSYALRSDLIRNLFHNLSSVAVWGAGSFTGNTLAFLKNEDLSNVEFIVDSDVSKQNMEFPFTSKPVVLPDKLKSSHIQNIVIMSQYVKEIMETIKALELDYSVNVYSLVNGVEKFIV